MVHDLSHSHKIGIAIGTALASLLLLSIHAIYLFRSRRRTLEESRADGWRRDLESDDSNDATAEKSQNTNGLMFDGMAGLGNTEAQDLSWRVHANTHTQSHTELSVPQPVYHKLHMLIASAPTMDEESCI